MDIEVNPFTREEFQIEIEEGLTAVQEQEAIREQIENTIRWRRVTEQVEIEVCVYISTHIKMNSLSLFNQTNSNFLHLEKWIQTHCKN